MLGVPLAETQLLHTRLELGFKGKPQPAPVLVVVRDDRSPRSLGAANVAGMVLE